MDVNDKVIQTTLSPCPLCRQILPASLLLREESLYLHRICPDHGLQENLFRKDYGFFKTLDPMLDKRNEKDPRTTFLGTHDHLATSRDLYMAQLARSCDMGQ